MKTLNIEVNGVSPLLMHKDTSVNRFHPLTKEAATISAKRKKSDDDHMRMAELDWLMALYYDEENGVHLPGKNVLACIRDAAKEQRLGAKVTSSCHVHEMYCPLDYEGPKKPERLFADSNFVDQQSVTVQRARVIRTRPIFDKWGLAFTISFDEERMDQDQILGILDTAGQFKGLGDYRPVYGKFAVSKVTEVE